MKGEGEEFGNIYYYGCSLFFCHPEFISGSLVLSSDSGQPACRTGRAGMTLVVTLSEAKSLNTNPKILRSSGYCRTSSE
jgi:hypothetical protein